MRLWVEMQGINGRILRRRFLPRHCVRRSLIDQCNHRYITAFLILSGALSLIEDTACNWMDFIDSSYSHNLSIAKMAAFMLFLCICSSISGGVFLNSKKRHTAVLYNAYGAIFCFWAIFHFIIMLKLDVSSELMTVILIFIVDIAIWVTSAIFMFIKGNIRKVLRQYIN